MITTLYQNKLDRVKVQVSWIPQSKSSPQRASVPLLWGSQARPCFDYSLSFQTFL